MRKRIPLTPADIEVDGRPGPISRIAFHIKDHWAGPKIKLAQAQVIEAIGLGYRNLKELQVLAISGTEPLPVPGSISRREIVQIFAWGVHRKCGISYASALELAHRAGLQTLAIDLVTSDAASEAKLLGLKRNNPRKHIALDEFHKLQGPFDSKWSDALIAAGALPFVYWVDSEGQAFSFYKLLEAARGLPQDLNERLAHEEHYAAIAGAELMTSTYLSSELIPGAAQPVGEAVRKGLLPTGTEIITLFNAAGHFRGRCLYYEKLQAIVPSVHMDSMVYQDVENILLGLPASTNQASASFDGNHKGKPGAYPGDEALFTLQSTYGAEYRAMLALIEAGKGDQIIVGPERLKALHNVVLRDARYVPAAELDDNHQQALVDGQLPPSTWATRVICGDRLYEGDQLLVRAQNLLQAEEFPQMLVAQLGVVPELSRHDHGDVTKRDYAVARRAKHILYQLEKDAERELSTPDALPKILALAEQLIPSAAVALEIDKLIAEALPQQPQTIHLAGLTTDEITTAMQAFNASFNRAQLALRDLGSDTAANFPSLVGFTHEQLGWITAISMGVEFGEEDETWEFEYLDPSDSRDVAALNSQLLLQACNFAAENTFNHAAGYSSKMLQVIAHQVLAGVTLPAEVGTSLVALSTFNWRTAYSDDVIRRIERWRAERTTSKAQAEALGLRSVGTPVISFKGVDFEAGFREARKIGFQQQSVTQSASDLS